MMFFVRSAFWLGVVYSSMPLDRGDALRTISQTQEAIVSSAVAAARAQCVQDMTSCQAILAATSTTATALHAERPPTSSAAPRAPGKGANMKPSANSLSAADLATPWRGRLIRSGA